MNATPQARWQQASATYQSQREAALSLANVAERERVLTDIGNQFAAQKQRIVLGEGASTAAEGGPPGVPPSRPPSLSAAAGDESGPRFSASPHSSGPRGGTPARTSAQGPFPNHSFSVPRNGGDGFPPRMERNPLLDRALGLRSVGDGRSGAGGHSGSVDPVNFVDGPQYPHQGTVRQDPSLISSPVRIGAGTVPGRLSKKMEAFLYTPEVRLPLRSKVSEAYIVPNGGLKSLIEDTLRVIDQVHSDGELPIIHIQESRARQQHGALQSWVPDDGGKPRALRISLSRYSAHKEFSLCHEVGHHIDLQAWPGNEPQTDALTNPLFVDWLFTTLRSTPARKLKAAVDDEEIDVVPIAGTQPMVVTTDKDFALYLLQPKELWARCYAQYIAKKSDNSTLLQQLDDLRTEIPGEVYYFQQWSDREFRPIMEKMDAIFQDKGWL